MPEIMLFPVLNRWFPRNNNSLPEDKILLAHREYVEVQYIQSKKNAVLSRVNEINRTYKVEGYICERDIILSERHDVKRTTYYM